MDAAVIAGTGVGGLVVGFLLCSLIQKGKFTTLGEQVTELAAKLDTSEKRCAKLQAELSGTTDTLRAKTEEVGKVQSRLEAAESQRRSAEDRIKAVQRSLEEASKAQQLSASQAAEAKQKMAALEDQLRQGEKEVHALKQLLERRKDGRGAKKDEKDPFVSAGRSLESVLKVLIERESQQVAVLADGTGIVVAGAGDEAMRDGVAATSKLIAMATKQLDGVVPFGALRAFLLQDTEKNVIAGKSFDFDGEVIALATFGPKLPSVRALEGAADELAKILA